VTWSFVFVNAEAQAELDALPLDVRASFERVVRLVQAFGLERVHEPYIRHLEGPIWGDAAAGKGPDCTRALCDSDRAPGGDPSGVHEEEPKDSTTRN